MNVDDAIKRFKKRFEEQTKQELKNKGQAKEKAAEKSIETTASTKATEKKVLNEKILNALQKVQQKTKLPSINTGVPSSKGKSKYFSEKGNQPSKGTISSKGIVRNSSEKEVIQRKNKSTLDSGLETTKEKRKFSEFGRKN